jgi:hypothetical protein
MGIAAAALLALAQAGPAAPAPAAAPGEVVLEIVVEDLQGRPVPDIQKKEVLLTQDDVKQEPTVLAYRADKGWYELRYVPSTGRVGAVAVGVNRRNTRLRGVDGPALKPRFVAPVAPFEVPLRAALDAAEPPPAALPFELGVLRFETRDDTLHHTLVAEVPLGAIKVEPLAQGARGHLSFLLRVQAEDGRIVHEGGLDQPVELDAAARGAGDPRRLIWTSHLHLRPGRYRAAVAAMDRLSTALTVRSVDIAVEPWEPGGVRVGDLTFLLGIGQLLGANDPDNPLTGSGAEMIATLHPRWVAGSEGAIPALLVVYPDPASTAPLTTAIELHREGRPTVRVPLSLTPEGPGVPVRQIARLRFGRMQLGTYTVKLVAEQGGRRAERSASLEVVPAPTMAP